MPTNHLDLNSAFVSRLLYRSLVLPVNCPLNFQVFQMNNYKHFFIIVIKAIDLLEINSLFIFLKYLYFILK